MSTASKKTAVWIQIGIMIAHRRVPRCRVARRRWILEL